MRQEQEILGMKRLCTICARGGSKGVPGKNTRMMEGLPLIGWSIRHARASNLFDAVFVSSDSREILECAKKCGASAVERPAELATDDAPKLAAIQHAGREAEALTGLSFDTFVDLDCTSPLRLVSDIAICVGMAEARGVRNVVTAAPSRHSPYFNVIEREGEYLRVVKGKYPAITSRQEAPETFDCNASIYVWPRRLFFDAKEVVTVSTDLYVMPRERSIDIDDELDFRIVEMLLKERADG